MDNYKIKVNDEAESKEAQELFFELGYVWADTKCQTPMKFTTSCIYSGFEDGELCRDYYDENPDHQELTIPQLRDLVVLKRNDVKDANCIDKKREAWYLASDGTYYAWQYRKLCWDTESDACVEAHDIKPITQPQDPALISGAEALRALADGKEVEYNWLNQKSSKWMLISEELKQFNLYEILSGITEFGAIKFRLKPQTIKLELELPKPFEPRDGDDCFIVDSEQEDGFYRFTYSENSGFHQNLIQFGAYKTEDDVKKAVEQLRKIRGTNS
ncbi:hypothetical protein IC765_19525 (plasmid) [Acinetobacter seifertii]|nr:hypothetical protein IC765_06230 [Acinetobacter seifertii]QNY19045.1 hypothetical protein IC765_19525 [Acinetobacter seifertii]